MTPDKFNPPSLTPFTGILMLAMGMVAAVHQKIEAMPMKTMLAIAGAVILALGTWGFTATHSYFQELKKDQIAIAKSVKEDLKDWRVELKADISKIQEANVKQDVCIAEIQQILKLHSGVNGEKK